MKKRTRPGGTRSKPYKRLRPAYSEDDKLAAVAIMLDHGGMTKEAIKLVQDYLGNGGISTQTLKRWRDFYGDKVKAVVAKPESNLAVAKVVLEAQSSALEMMQQLRDGLLKHAVSVLDDTEQLKKEGMRNVVVSVGVLQDKLDKARGLSETTRRKLTELSMLLLEDDRNIDDWLDQSIVFYQMKRAKQQNDNNAINPITQS